MGLASQKYDVLLNSQGYILISESYRKKAQQPFNPRFSTGDPSLTDLSFWQFMKQEGWSKGAGQRDFEELLKFQKSTGWAFHDGYPRLSGGNAPEGITPTEVANYEAVSGATCHLPAPTQLLQFGMTTTARRNIMLIGPGNSGFKMDGTRSVLRAAADNVTGIGQFLGSGGTIWRRQNPDSNGYDGYLAVCATTNYINFYDSQWNLVHQTTLAFQPRVLFPIDKDYILAIGSTTNNTLALARVKFSANSWTESAITYTGSSDLADVASPNICIDSNGIIHIPLLATRSLDTYEGFYSQILTISSADALDAQGPIISAVYEMPDYIITGAVNISGNIHYIGARIIRGTVSKYQAVVLQSPKTVIWESEYTSQYLYAVLPRAVWSDLRAEALFVNKCMDSGELQAVMRLTSDGVAEVFSFTEDAAGTRVDLTAICRVGSSVYAYDRGQNRILKATQDTAGTRTTAAALKLTSSRYGGNTPLVSKTLYSISVELSQAIPIGETLSVYANGTLAGTIVNANGTTKEIILGFDCTAPYFEVTYSMPATATWGGRINKNILRYVPTQFKKWSWGLGIRCDRNLKLIDGTRESKTGAQLYDALATAWTTNTPVTFVDVDGTSYSVLITDFDQRRPLLNDRGEVNEESFVFLELLQI